jgi:hypothetical protein
MGSRTLGLGFRITDVLAPERIAPVMAAHRPGDVVAFDEAQYFPDIICDAWQRAARDGIELIIGGPSPAQYERLCQMGATVAVPDHHPVVAELEEALVGNGPFPGERHAYQPLYGLSFRKFRYVREDCDQRLRLMIDGARAALGRDLAGRTYLDVGCCTGFFCEGMAGQGCAATGVDVQAPFLEIGARLAELRGSNVRYVKEDALTFSEHAGSHDIVSSFATIQWVMAQRGYDAGLGALTRLMAAARSVFVLEMGYTEEKIYRDKIDTTIDRDWTRKALAEIGGFANVTLHQKGTNGIWRDMFVATR